MKKIVLTKPLAFLYKFAIVFGISTLGFFVLVAPFLGIFGLLEEQSFNVIALILFIIAYVLGVYVIVLPFIAVDPNNVFAPKAKAEKILANVTDFKKLMEDVDNAANAKEFVKSGEKHFEDYELHLYSKQGKNKLYEFVLVLKTDELTHDILRHSNEQYIKLVEEVFCEISPFDSGKVRIVTLVCVNRISLAFRNLVDEHIEQDFRRDIFYAGLSFGGKKLYIPPKKSAYFKSPSPKCKKMFLDFFGFLIKNRE